MTLEECKARINDILSREFEIEPGLLKPEAQLGQDLGLDSLDAVDLVVSIEKKFGFRMQEEEARSMRTLGDIYAYIEKHGAASGEGRAR